ncbi:MAG: HAD-IA family hydrolase [Acidobacteriia bacterium]|nr:HAD-IA family hydrolase [Terriglobia bacterium]
MRYPFVLLDAGETLFGPRESFGAVYSRVLAPMGLVRSAEVFESAIRESWREMDREVPPGTDRYAFFDGGEDGYWLRFARGAIDRAAGAPMPCGFAESALAPLREAFRDPAAWHVFPDVRPALSEIRHAGGRLAVVSNWDSRLPYLLEVLDLDDLFDAVAGSHMLGVEKPNPRIFRSAIEALGADPRLTLHVGDLPETDLDGARSTGIDGVLVDRRCRLTPGPGVIADFEPLPRIVRDGLPSAALRT